MSGLVIGDKTSADSTGNPVGPQATVAATTAQLAGGSIDLRLAAGAQLQIAGLSADTIAVSHSEDGINFVTATLLKNDLSTVTATALTGSSANGIYSVMGFGGYLKVQRTGSADTLTVTLRGTA
jgi:hypothetical protein